MSMSNPTAPVPNEHTGYGSTAGPAEYANTRPYTFAGQDQGFALLDDGTYIWMGTGSTPARLVRILKADPNTWISYTLTGPGEDACVSLADDGTYIWMGMGTVPAMLVRVPKAGWPLAPLSHTTYWLGAGEDACAGIAQDSTYIWMGLQTTPAMLARVPKAGWPLAPLSHITYTLAAGQNSCMSIADDGTYIWMGMQTVPAMLARVPKAGWPLAPLSHITYTLNGAGEANCNALVQDGTNIWMALWVSPAMLVRVPQTGWPLAPLSHTTYTLAAGQNLALSIAQDSTYVWMGLQTSPAVLVRFLKADPATRTIYTLAADEATCYALALDATYVWMSAETSVAGMPSATALLARVPRAIGTGFVIAADNLLCVTRVVSVRERTGRLLCQLAPAVAGDLLNQVRIRVNYPHHSHLSSAIHSALMLAAAVPTSHPVVNIKAALVPLDHLHTISLANNMGVPNVVETLGALGVAGGRAGNTGIQGTPHLYDVGADVVHAAWTGVVATVPAGSEECPGIDLSTYIFDLEAAGF